MPFDKHGHKKIRYPSRSLCLGLFCNIDHFTVLYYFLSFQAILNLIYTGNYTRLSHFLKDEETQSCCSCNPSLIVKTFYFELLLKLSDSSLLRSVPKGCLEQGQQENRILSQRHISTVYVTFCK